MKKKLGYKTVLFTATWLLFAVPAFAQGLTMSGELPPQGPSDDASWTDKVKSGFNKFTKKVLPEKEEPQKIDELSLSRKADPSPELHAALGQSCEQKGQTQNAILEYEKALDLDPNHKDALLQYAQFSDRINQTQKAEVLYHKAIQAHPRDAQVFNHQGLFFVRHQRYAEAAEAFSTAVALEPIQESYRGNLAVVLVDLGRYSEAYKQLRAVQSPDTAYYNLGYLLQERGKKELAIKHFQVALNKNPNHKEARIWMEHLQSQQDRPMERIASQAQSQVPPIAQSVPFPPQSGMMSAPVNPPVANLSPVTQPLPAVAPNLAQQQPTIQPPAQPWQPQLPPGTTAPIRTHSYYRTTVPPARQQPFAVPDPAIPGQGNVPQVNGSTTYASPPGVSTISDSNFAEPIQAESPSLIVPVENSAPIQRLPSLSSRRTVNTTSDRYITPLPPIDWSDKFKVGQ